MACFTGKKSFREYACVKIAERGGGNLRMAWPRLLQHKHSRSWRTCSSTNMSLEKVREKMFCLSELCCWTCKTTPNSLEKNAIVVTLVVHINPQYLWQSLAWGNSSNYYYSRLGFLTDMSILCTVTSVFLRRSPGCVMCIYHLLSQLSTVDPLLSSRTALQVWDNMFAALGPLFIVVGLRFCISIASVSQLWKWDGSKTHQINKRQGTAGKPEISINRSLQKWKSCHGFG